MKPQTGNRKYSASITAQLLTVLCFVLACYMKADHDLFLAAVIGINGTNLSFMWGNSQEHKAAAAVPSPTQQ